MPAARPTIYLIAGCNGAGKTTFAKEFLPHEVKCLRFYNADELARGLSPLDPSAAAIKAGRLLLAEVRDSISRRETFALESTLWKDLPAFAAKREGSRLPYPSALSLAADRSHCYRSCARAREERRAQRSGLRH